MVFLMPAFCGAQSDDAVVDEADTASEVTPSPQIVAAAIVPAAPARDFFAGLAGPITDIDNHLSWDNYRRAPQTKPFLPDFEPRDTEEYQPGSGKDHTDKWHYGALGADYRNLDRFEFPFGENFAGDLGPFPLIFNPTIERYVHAYLTHSGALRASFARSAPYRDEIIAALQAEGIPSDFIYLAFAESAFIVDGDGPWQFTRATARRFGLRINQYVDERRDPIRSSRMAAKYLSALHSLVGDWRLTVVGWNLGEGAVAGFVSKIGRDYDLIASSLPPRTRALLNRFTAVAYIARNQNT